MHRRLLALPLLFLLTLAIVRAEAPRVLVVQEFVLPKGRDQDNNLKSASVIFAQLMEDTGRVQPIVWSLTDPLFREAVTAGSLVNPPDRPTLAQVREAMKPLRADYLLTFNALRDAERVYGEVRLFRGTSARPLWTDKKDISVLVGNLLDLENAGQSLFRTWNELLNSGPFKSHPPQPRAQTPDPDPGQVTPVVQDPIPPPAQVGGAALADAKRMMGEGKYEAAVSVLRDAVDAAPMDVERRILLVGALMKVDPALAAEEAARAAEVIPDAAGLRAVSARAWLLAGDGAKAQEQLNEALARDPKNPEVIVLVGRARLADLKPQEALDALKPVLAEPTDEVRLLAGMANALLGNQAKAEEWLAATKPAEADYPMGIDLLDRTANALGASVRSLIPRMRLVGEEKSEAEESMRLSRQSSTMVWLAERLAVPERHRGSHDRRLLALKLLRQCVDDAGSFLKDRDEDYLSESTINLGEALKQLSAAREQYRQESSP